MNIDWRASYEETTDEYLSHLKNEKRKIRNLLARDIVFNLFH